MLQQGGIETVLVKRGTKGALLLGRGDLCISQPAFPAEKARAQGHSRRMHAPDGCRGTGSEVMRWSECGAALQVVDTTGAGDCFTASYAVAMLESKGAAEALQFAGALFMTRQVSKAAQ